MSYKQLLEEANIIVATIKEEYIPENPFKSLIPYAKVLILGQDPYPSRSLATGRAFEVPENKMAPSLKNILKIIGEGEYAGLKSWEDQLVCLHNVALTTRPGESNVHINHWYDFTKKYLVYLLNENPKLIVLALGNFAKKVVREAIPGAIILETSHPSPLARVRDFDTSRIFQRCNELLELNKEKPIIWQSCFKVRPTREVRI